MKYVLQDGVEVASTLEPIFAEIGLHLAIGGSLVYRGGSDKDIDIFIYPHSRDIDIDRDAIAEKLSGLGYPPVKSIEDHTSVLDVLMTRHIENGKRVDFFFLERHNAAAWEGANA